ncbi:PHD finger and BAH domain (Snt2) [Cordyceps militaris]|uniref:PHD finger and BAH domain (Snt2) n=1 Tax=Cordyceps militaris TaxID=73501 RepID=A0A2H4S642_CORMI|nr:PHD finger and BAH domain (Snt2) [Cordyceps militaris]
MAQQSDSRPSDPDPKTGGDAMANLTGAVADKDAGADGAVPYGTRSRNRNGNARINYAEDKDIEMDNYDYYDKMQGEAPKKPSRLVTMTTTTANGGETSGRVAAGGRKPLTGSAPGSDDSKMTASHAHTAATSNGQSSAGATAASSAAASRKRKAVNGSAAQVVATAAATATTTTTGGQSARRVASANAAQSVATSIWPETNMLSFEDCESRPQNGRLVADDGTVLEANDYVYLVCEPPGEPYYLGRIMEFLHAQNDPARPVDAVRINWFYRPKDIGRKVSDARLVIATMHSDISPLAALRGKCQIRHRVEIDDFEEYRKSPDCFWYEKLYDRYIQKHYDLIPTTHIINVPDKVKQVLDERWKFVLVEQGRGKELTSAVKSCKRCSGYCASNDSVDCAVCTFTYHMNCVRPPLLKKPSRGFAWSCGACSRAQERKLENRHTVPDGEDDEDPLDEDEEDAHDPNTTRTTPIDDEKVHHKGTAEQIYHASLWPYRYLGLHCKPEDALDLDDRIYPRASTRLGARNQATVLPWPGRPVEYVKPFEIKRGKGGTKNKDIQEEKAMRGKRPFHSALDSSPENDETSTKHVIAYMDKARETAKSHGLPKQCTNLQDVAIADLYRQNYNPDKALAMLAKTPMPDFKEPRLTAAEEKRWEEAISKYGSELFLVKKHVKTMSPGQVVRRYYSWKKSDRGKQIWGSYSGRKGKKQGRRAEAPVNKIADEVADNEDDSAFDTAKATEKKRTFVCLFCVATNSRQWRRAPGSMQGLLGGDIKPTPKDKNNLPLVALCRRCAELWRRYAIRWEDIDEVTKKVTQNGKTYKRKQDEELLKELQAAQEHGLMTPDRDSTPLSGTTSANGVEPPRKRLKVPIDRDFDPATSDGGSVSGAGLTKKKDKDTINEATPKMELPQARKLPCAICSAMEPLGDQHVSCRECRLTVHRNCYGIVDNRTQGKWLCDMCTNDKNPQVSISYKCVLCPVEHTEHEFVEQPKLTHHKKKMSPQDRERERLDVQQARKAVEHYRKHQEELNRPANPREPLKRTADNNWVHVTCAVWTPEVKFGNSKAMEPSEGIPSIPKLRYDEVCHACNQAGNGACIPCHHCRTTFHVECARQAGHLLAFDMTPIKSSRRDQHNIVTIHGESGTMSALLWCKDHIPSKIITHRMHDIVGDNGLTALQLYVHNFKQADLTLTGTVRKANLLTMAAKAGGAAFPATHRASSTTAANGAPLVAGLANGEHGNPATNAAEPGEKVCISCGVDVTLRWWPIDTNQERQLANGHYGAIGSEAQKFVEQRKFQCHKCKKLAKSPRPHHTPATLSAPATLSTPAPLSTPDSRPSFPTQAPSSMPSLRSPPPPPRHWFPSARPSHPPSHAFSTPPSSRYEWFPNPIQHTSTNRSPPTSHLNGSPVNVPPPPISALRPPPTSGPPPPLGMGHRHSPSPMYSNSLPISPHSLRGPPPPPPPPPSAYVPSYRGLVGHPSPHGLNGGPPLPPPRDSFAHGLHPQRSQYRSSVHVSPSGPPPGPNGMPPHPPRDHMSARSDPRPDGASASPALRNLLS